MNNTGGTPEKDEHTILPAHDPRQLKRLKFSMLPGKVQQKLNDLSEDAASYDKWFDQLDEKQQLLEYEAFFLDGEGEIILRSKMQMLEDKALRMRYIRKIEQLKNDGKLEDKYRLK